MNFSASESPLEVAVHLGKEENRLWGDPDKYQELVTDLAQQMADSEQPHSEPEHIIGVLLTLAEAARLKASNREKLRGLDGEVIITNPTALAAALYDKAILMSVRLSRVAKSAGDKKIAELMKTYNDEGVAGIDAIYDPFPDY
jgi:hypothetical protein